MRSLDRPRSVRELALISGTTESRVRAAIEDGLINRANLSWADVIAVRSFIPSQSIVLAGEAVPRNLSRETTERSRSAVAAVHQALSRDEVDANTVLAVGRAAATVYRSLATAIADGDDLNADGALLVLPIGQWWTEVRWRGL